MATAASPAEVLMPSTEKTNYIRLVRLLMCGGTTIVRGVFDSIIPPSQLPRKLKEKAVVSRLQQMKRGRILTSPQWKTLFPSPSTYGKSESFDITLLFKLLREFCGLPQPPKGWDVLPDDKDQSLSADLARMKYHRNELCHAKEDLGISNGDFNTYGNRIKGALLRMVQTLPGPSKAKDWEDKIDKLLTGPITDEDESNIEELKSWYRQDIEVKAFLLEQLPDAIADRLEERRVVSQQKHRDDYGESLVKFLKEYYSKGEWSLILPFHRMEGDRFHIDNQYTPLTISDKEQDNSIEVADLFAPRKGNTVRRVLIEGEAGIGKSTFCKKIAYDWSKDKLQIPDVDLVLVIKCCDLKGGDLWQAIKEQNLPEDLHGTEKAEEVFDYIRDNQERVLLILDGFDEIPSTTEATMKQSIKELVTGQLLSAARVILTSRPEKCSDLRKGFDRKLEMNGFSWGNSRQFIKNFCSSSHNIDETMSSLEENAALKEFPRYPLNIAFLCLILEEREVDGDFFKSLDLGSLYHKMVFCVFKRYCVEKRREEVQDKTLLDKYHEAQVLLGKIAFNLIKDNLTQVAEEELPADSEITEVLRDIGFLIENKSLNRICPTITYSFSHSSIKEYFAAFYVAECLSKGNIDILTSINTFTENPSSSGIGYANHVQNVYYSLQRFNLAEMMSPPSNEDYIKLINGLAAHLPKDIDVSQAELTRFDFIFTFICELLGSCKGDQVIEVLEKIAVADLPIVFYFYNGRQALDGFVSLLSQSKDGTSKVQIKMLRLEGLQVVSPSIPTESFIKFSAALGEHTFLKTLYLSFFSNSAELNDFFDNFKSTSVDNLGFPNTLGAVKCWDYNFATITRHLSNLSCFDLSNNDFRRCEFLSSGNLSTKALRVLKLCNFKLRSGDVDSILRSLRTSTTLQELDLSGNDFSGGISFDLASSTLQVLRMNHCNLRSGDVDSILSSLRRKTKLKELDLSGNDFSGGISFDLAGSKLQVLRMKNCNLRSGDVDSILSSLRRKTKLKELDLSGNDFSGGISFDLAGSKLQVLRMSHCNLRSDDIGSILCCLRGTFARPATLKELDLSGNATKTGDQMVLRRYFPTITLQL